MRHIPFGLRFATMALLVAACSPLLGLDELEGRGESTTAPTPSDEAGTDGSVVVPPGERDAGGDADAAPSDAGDASADGGDGGSDGGVDAGPVYEVLLSNIPDPGQIALNPTHVYFTQADSGKILRVPLGGGTVETVAQGVVAPTSISFRPGFPNMLRLTSDFRYLKQCSVDVIPCTPQTLTDRGASTYPGQLTWEVTQQGFMYWIDVSGSTVRIGNCVGAVCEFPTYRYTSTPGDPLHGTNPTGLVAISGTELYVTNYQGSLVKVANGQATLLQSVGFSTTDLERDGTLLRWPVVQAKTISQCTYPGCATTTPFRTNTGGTVSTRSNATHVYGLDEGTGPGGRVLWRIAKTP